jgi:hypothetical protein
MSSTISNYIPFPYDLSLIEHDTFASFHHILTAQLLLLGHTTLDTMEF